MQPACEQQHYLLVHIMYLPSFFPDDPSESVPVVPLPLPNDLLPLPPDLPRGVAPAPPATVVQAQALRSRLGLWGEVTL